MEFYSGVSSDVADVYYILGMLGDDLSSYSGDPQLEQRVIQIGLHQMLNNRMLRNRRFLPHRFTETLQRVLQGQELKILLQLEDSRKPQSRVLTVLFYRSQRVDLYVLAALIQAKIAQERIGLKTEARFYDIASFLTMNFSLALWMLCIQISLQSSTTPPHHYTTTPP